MTSVNRDVSPAQAALQESLARVARERRPRRETASACRSQRVLSMKLSNPGVLSGRARGRICARQPRFRRAPVPQDGRLRHVEQRGRLGDIESAEIPALDHRRLSRMNARQVVERGVQREQIVGALTPVARPTHRTSRRRPRDRRAWPRGGGVRLRRAPAASRAPRSA